MPREGTSDSLRKMGRHQACHRCRRRKLKCDGALPCGPCQRAHTHDVRTRPTAAGSEPACIYDHPDLIAEGPKGRIAHLENEIAELRELLEAANAKLACCTCGAATALETNIFHADSLSPLEALSSLAPTPPGLLADLGLSSTPGETEQVSSLTELFTTAAPTTNIRIEVDTSSLPIPSITTLDSTVFFKEAMASTSTDVYPAAWPPNIPPPVILFHLVETFFASVPLASRLIHKPTFMVSLRQLPTSLDFPHIALLHAICGLASLYSPIISDPTLNRARASAAEGVINPSIASLLDVQDGEHGKRRFPKTLFDLDGDWDEGFGASHIRLASMTLRLSVREGDRLLQMLQAAVICTWYMYDMGMTIGIYTWINTVTKLVGPLGVYCADGFEPLSRLPTNMLFLFGKAKTPIEAETVRNAFWISYVMERVYNAGNAWPLSISDEDISQMMPCRFSDFITGEHVPTHNRQRIFTENMLLVHPTLTTDSWTLYIKASILLSRVKSFNSRFRILLATKHKGSTFTSVMDNEDFQHLDQSITTFLRGIPRAYKDPVGTSVDPLLYMAHLLPHVAMIQLHDPHANPFSPNDYSAQQMQAATRAILDLIYKLCGTAYDLLYMDHACSFCWFVAGAALIRFLRVKIMEQNEEEALKLEQELGIVKFMLRNLGERTIIGHRQIRVLDDIYNVAIKGQMPKPTTAPASVYERVETDNLVFANMQ